MSRAILGTCLFLGLAACANAEADPTLEVPSAEAPAPVGLEAVRARGELRFLLHGAPVERLSRAGLHAAHDRLFAKTVAAALGAEARFVRIAPDRPLVEALLAEEGDVILERLALGAAARDRVILSEPVRIVSEVLVGGPESPRPEKPEDLAGLEVHVRRGSRHAATLRAHPGIRIVESSQTVDALARAVARGELLFTVVDSDELHELRAYVDGLRPALELAQGHEVTWPLRQDEASLLAAVNEAILREGVLARPTALGTGDLDALKERGELRVLTRNQEVSYFIHRGRAYGLDFELVRELAKSLRLRLVMVVPPRRDLLIPWLLEGRGDLVAASFTKTPPRAEEVRFSKPYLSTRELVVGNATATDVPFSPAELAGRDIHVPASSSYHQSLTALEPKLGPYDLVATKETVATTALLDQVARRDIPLTVADAHILAVKKSYEPDLRGLFPLPDPATGAPAEKEIAFAVRPSNPRLLARVNGWLESARGAQMVRVLSARYLKNANKNRRRSLEWARSSGQISRFDPLIMEAARARGLDWRLMAAQAYVESRFDPSAKSWAGAVGLFQILPSTARHLGYDRIDDPAVSALAAAHYLDRLIGFFDEPHLPYRVRVQFALAAYNAGYGHVLDARRLAKKKGLDPDRWFENVEKAMLLLAKPKYARLAQHGFCRGGEPVKYVRRIQDLYEAYTDLAQG